jgi:hypothetical protein
MSLCPPQIRPDNKEEQKYTFNGAGVLLLISTTGSGTSKLSNVLSL